MQIHLSVLGTLLIVACSTNKPADDPTSSDVDMVPASRTEGRSDADRPDVSEANTTTSEAIPLDDTVEDKPTTRTTRNEDAAAVAPSPKDANADNTEKNQRDSESGALTPVDQGNNETDLGITSRIRQALIGDGSLSFTAKNVKVITVNGKVTLRGPVKSAEERAIIDAAAKRVAGAGNVDNQLEIKK